jgi:hypothetical protein
VRDVCPDGDFSGSLYDDECDAPEDALLDGGSVVDGYIFYDDNQNGSFDSDEDPVQGAIVTLFERDSRDNLGSDITNSRGYYEFVNIQPGDYTIRVELPVSFFQSVLAFFVGSVNAQTSYEFNVSVSDDGQIVQQDIAVERDGSVDSVNMEAEDEVDAEEIIDTLIQEETQDETATPSSNSILDGFANLDVSAPVVSETQASEDFMLPTRLPDTGANPA